MFRNISLIALMIASIGAARAGTGQAGDITIETEPFVSTRTMAELRQELVDNPQVSAQYGEDSGSSQMRFSSTRSRREIVQDFIAQRHIVAAMSSEDSGSALLSAARPGIPEYLAER